MRPALLLAWAAGLGIVTWRTWQADHKPPVPGVLLGVTGLFMALGLAAEYPPAAGPAVMLGWGLNVAGLMDILPAGLYGQISQAQIAEQQSEAGLKAKPAPKSPPASRKR